MGRKKTGKTPVFSYRHKPSIFERMGKVYRKIGTDWNEVFETLLNKWDEPEHKCNTEIISVIQKKEVEKSEGNKILDILYKINPMLNYANRTQRASADRLIQKMGLEKACRTAEAAVAAYGQQFAPTITTPIQLENKLSELISFYKRQQKNNLVITDPNL